MWLAGDSSHSGDMARILLWLRLDNGQFGCSLPLVLHLLHLKLTIASGEPDEKYCCRKNDYIKAYNRDWPDECRHYFLPPRSLSGAPVYARRAFSAGQTFDAA